MFDPSVDFFSGDSLSGQPLAPLSTLHFCCVQPEGALLSKCTPLHGGDLTLTFLQIAVAR